MKMTRNLFSLLLIVLCILPYNITAQVKSDAWLEGLLKKQSNHLLQRVLNSPDSFQYQVIYTQVERDKNNKPSFKNFYLNVDRQRYHYPASTVKLPVALMALEKLSELNKTHLDKYSVMVTDSAYRGQTPVLKDSTAETGMPSVAHYIRKIFVVSDNDAYNRLYEFIGQQEANERLWKKGYEDMRIIHRFVRLTPEENRHTNPIRFLHNGEVIYEQPAQVSNLKIDTTDRISVGERYLDNEEKLINQPMDFTMKNRFPLEDLQKMLQSVVFPESVPEKLRFALSEDDRRFLLRHMSQLPSETSFPSYDTTEFFDSYTKFYFFRANKSKIPDHIRVFNKAGWSYGFLTDAAYIVDVKNNVEFMLTGTIYTNTDGTLNDDRYEYEQIGWPFFKEVGEAVYQYELVRPREFRPVFDRNLVTGSQ